MRPRFYILLLAVVVLAAYYPALSAPLSSVDDTGLYFNLLNNDSFNLRSTFFPGASSGYYRPLLQVSFFLDKYVWGVHESFLHLTNILLHLFNTILVFLIGRRICRYVGGEPKVALAAAILFGLHPINTESVCWVSGRTDPLAAAFLLLAVLALLHRRRPLSSSLVAALLMILACLVKETAIFFLPAALAFPLYLPDRDAPGPESLRVALGRQVPHFIIFLAAGAGYFLLRHFALLGGDQGVAQVLTHAAGNISRQTGPGPLAVLGLMLKAVGFYAKKLLVPFPLSFAITHVSDAYLYLGLLVCAGCVLLVLRRTAASFLGLCTVSIGSSALLIALLNVTWTPLAERYMYIPSAFFVLSCCLVVQRWQFSWRENYTLVAFCLVALSAFYGTFTRSLLWQDNLAFFQDTARKAPGFAPALNEVATALRRRGRTDEAARVYEGMHLDRGLKNYQNGMMSKAATYLEQGHPDEARRVLHEALKDPGNLEAVILTKLLEVDNLEMLKGKTTVAEIYPESAQWLTRLYQITGDPFHQYRLGVLSHQAGKEEVALAAFQEVCRKASPDAYYRKPAEKLVARLAMNHDDSATGETLKR